MNKVRIIPTVLFRDTNTMKGKNFKSWRVVGSVMQSIKLYSLREVDELIFLDVTATKNKEINYDLINDFAKECFMPVVVGGGIRNINDNEAISIAFTIHELKRSKRDAFYYLVGIDIQNNYRLTNKSSIGLIPRIGYGYNLKSVAHLSLNIGYIIYDYNNISSEFNEYTISVGIGINLIEFFDYVVPENH